VDGLGAIPEVLTKNSTHPLTRFSEYHHMLHNVAFALLVGVAAFALATRRWKTFAANVVASTRSSASSFPGGTLMRGCPESSWGSDRTNARIAAGG
jgi:hypothetical protein